MADILETVLSGSFLLDDFKVWLISDSAESCADKANFIPYFLNHVKEKCAWMTSKDGKSLESPSCKLLRSEDKQQFELKDHTSGPSKKSPKNSPVKVPVKNHAYDKKEETTHFRNNKPNKFQESNRKKGHNTIGEYLSYNQPKGIYNERNFHKSHCSAKKNLNFNCINDVNSKNGQMFQSDINNFDAFPPLNAKVNETKRQDSKVRRRITPTPIQAFHKGSSRFNIPTEKVPNDVFKMTPFVETPSSNLQNEREMLKITRNQLSQSTVITNSFSDLKLENNSPVKKVVYYMEPDPEKISHRDQLETISSVYAVLMSNALVPNITSELYFIFEVLTSKVSFEDKSEDENGIFSSVHNCMFFGVSVLSKLQNLLHLLDQNTLLSLCKIPFLGQFSLKLVDFLQTCCKEKEETVARTQSLHTVPFFVEEDSRENFIDGYAFTSFRKQRDLFYELLRDWQQQPLDSIDVKFQENFNRKAKHLINLAPNAVNMHHLAKLFQNQLIASCLGLEVNEVYDELLSNIQRNFPGKLEKLHQRFMMPFCVGEPNPPPTFYGIQAFFCELIQAASSASLNQQLQDIFVSKILDFNSTDIFSDGELSSLGTVKEKYIFLLHSLRLLGKFLGYLYFLPYKVPQAVPASILTSQLIYRKHSVPPIDILKMLKSAVENNRVILTAPWIVEFLSMIDPVGKSLSYVEDTLKILVSIYRGKYILSPDSLNFWLLRIMIGWLFDVLSYPPKYFSILQPIILENNVKHGGLDFLAIIDKQLVHSCCPYLIEFKVLIHGFLNGIKNDKKREVRKITPLSTTKPHISTSQAKQQTEMQIEENFFFLQPPSMKKTVEFVSERIASKIISKIRSEVTEFKLLSIDYITKDETYKALLNSKSSSSKKLKAFIDSCILQLYEKSQSKIDKVIHIDCLKDIEQIMPYLFSDIKPQILKMCCKISYRLAVDKITDWCEANLILVNIKKDIKNKLSHLSKGEGEVKTDIGTKIDISLSTLISTLRNLIVNIHSGPCTFTNDHTQILSEVLSIMDKEFGQSIKKVVAFLTVDLYIALIIHYPEKCSDECNRSFVQIWSICPKNYEMGNYYLGIQNIKFLMAAENFELGCELFVHMLLNLINDDIFDVKKLKKCWAKLNSLRLEDSKAKRILSLVSNALLKYDS